MMGVVIVDMNNYIVSDRLALQIILFESSKV
jgi:hypothetical protein